MNEELSEREKSKMEERRVGKVNTKKITCKRIEQTEQKNRIWRKEKKQASGKKVERKEDEMIK